MKKTILTMVLILTCILAFSACAEVVPAAPTPGSTVAPEATVTPKPEETPDVTQEPDATDEPVDTEAPEATVTPEPTEETASVVTETPAGSPGESTEEAPSSEPTATPTPAPTQTPTPTPKPTPTPTPTPQPTPTPTPKPVYKLNELIRSGKKFTVGFKLEIYCAWYNEYTVGQGVCSDGEYAYFILKPSADGEAIIKKYSLVTGEFVKRSQPIYVFHGNDMTFDTARNVIYVVHGSSEGKILTTVDPDTLEVIQQTVNIKKGAGAITYSPTRDCFAISQGGNHLTLLDKDLKVTKTVTREKMPYTAQGMGSDDDYIYFPMSPKAASGTTDNILAVYDWDCNYITTVKMPTKVESESMFVIDGVYYVSFYSGDGARLFRLTFDVVD
ncbi:MAG: hypothetical protein IJS71_02335 [Clostridia bacterium]|nr:hypothetical protein [Clostridia bacterium]